MKLRGGLFNGSPFDGNKSTKEIDPSQTRLLNDEVMILGGNTVCAIDEDIGESRVMIIRQRTAKIRHEGNITCLATVMSTQQEMIVSFV